jgi:hypothetical protein
VASFVLMQQGIVRNQTIVNGLDDKITIEKGGLGEMKKVLLIIASICILFHSVSISQDNPIEQELITSGYLLSKESNKFKLIRTELLEVRKKLLVLNGLDNSWMCHVTMLIENIFLAETICMYESILLSTLQSIEDRKKMEQYRLLDSRLRKVILKKLYLNYKNIQLNYAKIDDKAILELADKAKEEMLTTLRVIEGTIKILRSQNFQEKP